MLYIFLKDNIKTFSLTMQWFSVNEFLLSGLTPGYDTECLSAFMDGQIEPSASRNIIQQIELLLWDGDFFTMRKS